MLKERLIDFFKDVGFIVRKITKSRIIPFVIFATGLFLVLFFRLFKLQIVKGDSYSNSYQLKAEKTITTPGVRANIYDRNGKLLAYSDLAYSVVISDSGYYDSVNMKNSTLNNIIDKMISIINDNGDSIIFDFGISCNSKNNYYYLQKDNSLLRFLRDIYGKKSIAELSEEEKTANADTTAKFIMKQFGIYTEDIKAEALENGATEEDFKDITIYDKKRAIEIAYIRYNLNTNSYKRYVTFEVAQNVKPATMAAILENQDVLTGVNVEENTIRHYNEAVYISHIVGYTVKISAEQLDEFKLINENYEASDVVGKVGIEEKYETVLAGEKGEKKVLVDNVGRVVETVEETPATVGKDVYLTIDIDLQKEIYNLLERRLAEMVAAFLTTNEEAMDNTGFIRIPVKEVCFALINNNVIDIDAMAKAKKGVQAQVYSQFKAKKSQVLKDMKKYLKSETAFNDENEEMQEYIKLLRRLLMNNDILNADKIDSNVEAQKKWTLGEISLREYFRAAIDNQWINIHNLNLDSEYPSIDEVLNVLIAEGINEFKDSSDFDKLVYKYLIDNHSISQKDICLILMDQKGVEFTESEYRNIENGGSVYEFLYDKIINRKITPAQLALDPCSGSCVVENPNNGEILAMVSYPSYDINKFSGTIDNDYYQMLLNDKSTPLVNRALFTKIAPGSTFKPLVAVAGLNEGVMGEYETIQCDGIFDRISPNIKCWCYPRSHGMLNTSDALMKSCNDYFCEIGYRLSTTPSGKLSMDYGLSRLKEYAEQFGLATKSGIQLDEATPHASDYNSVVSAIGQGTHAYTSTNLARYISAVANRGTVYNSSIVKSIQSQDKTDITLVEPVVANKIEVSDNIWSAVHLGMEKVVQDCALHLVTDTIEGVTIHGKSGTAQEDKNRADHANFVMFSTRDGKPEVVVSSMIPYGHQSNQTGFMTYYALAAYYKTKMPTRVIYGNGTHIIYDE